MCFPGFIDWGLRNSEAAVSPEKNVVAVLQIQPLTLQIRDSGQRQAGLFTAAVDLALSVCQDQAVFTASPSANSIKTEPRI